ncbi:MAG TPA: indolepyruvate ferredoxin oxidoreductase family protein, partial [Acidimicrobiales bacterium]|nr:indolepyruvate ferredoxin oxidoreductase family protein [Acidimicrobiales bacterium]
MHTPTLKLAGKATLDLERSLYTTRLEIARRYITANGLNQVVVRGPADRIGILAAGKTWLDLRQALATIGLTDDLLRHHGIRLIKLGALYPLDADELRRFTSGLDQLVVVEEKRPFVESQLRDLLYRDAVRPDILGKTDAGGGELFPAAAELDADAIAAAIVGPLQAGGPIPAIGQWRDRRTAGPGRSIPLAVRTPYFCSGCPHNRSTKVPDDALVGGGIGCHGMAVLMSPTQVGRIMGLTQMGGEGAQWIGMAPFAGERHIFQNLGDGTYFHSGSLAVRAAVAAGVNVTYKIMYNSAIAMTGGQDPAGGRPIGDLVRILLAEGARRVIVTSDDPKRTARTGIPRGTDVWHRDRLEEAQIELAKMDGVTVLVHDQECAAERRRKRKRHKAPDPPTRYAINPRICEGCGDCGVKSNCLSLQPVETEYGTKTRINQASCNKDYSCVDGDCPSFVAVRPVRRRRTPAGGTGPTGAGQSPTRPAGTLPAPPLAPRDHCSLRLLGIGGTGVMTAAQIVAVAAMVDGLQLRGLDQTGLAQKGGPVVSDLVITGTEAEVGNKLGEASCDLYLVFDMVVGANPDNLRVATPATTAVVASTDLTPTADMIGHLDKTLAPTEEFVERIAERTDPGRSAYMDAHTICEQRFGGAEYVNVFLLGVASQRGLLPMRPEAVEQAIERNGASVATNLAAFDLGRRWVLDATLRDDPPPTAAPAQRSDVPGTAQRALEERCVAAGLPTTGTLAELVRRRAADLVGYQSVSYACRYIDFVGSVYRRESERHHDSDSDGDGELSRTVAVYLHK